MDPIEARLKALALPPPPDGLRRRVLSAARPAPTEWKRLQHTLEGCAVALMVVFAGCAWFEHGSEALRQSCRTTPPDIQRGVVVQQVADVMDGLDAPDLRRYLAARLLEDYARPYVVRPDS